MDHNKLFCLMSTDNMTNIIVRTQYFTKMNDYQPFIVHVLDILSKAILMSQSNGFNQYKVHVFFNNTKLSNLDISFFKDFIKLLMNTFPEALNECYLYDFPKVFKPVYKILAPFIDKNTRSKIKFTKSNKPLDINVSYKECQIVN